MLFLDSIGLNPPRSFNMFDTIPYHIFVKLLDKFIQRYTVPTNEIALGACLFQR